MNVVKPRKILPILAAWIKDEDAFSYLRFVDGTPFGIADDE